MFPLPGDVVLYPEDSELSSHLVAFGERIMGLGREGAEYTHAAVLSGMPGYQYEAKFPFTGQFKIDTSRSYEVWRLGNPTELQRTQVLHWCDTHVGDFYNLTGVLTCGLVEIPGTYYCSQFVCLAYAAAGMHPGDLVMDPDSIPQYPGAQMLLSYDPAKS